MVSMFMGKKTLAYKLKYVLTLCKMTLEATLTRVMQMYICQLRN